MADPIRSPANTTIKELRRLQRAAERRRTGRFVAEGRRLIDGFLQAGHEPVQILLREDLDPPASWPAALVQRAAPAAFERASSLQSPPGYLAVFPLPPAARLDPGRGGLLLDGVADPGNCGSLLRCAAAFGIGQVALLGGADPYAPKVVQASAGALALLQLARIGAEDLRDWGARAAPILALCPSGGLPPERWPAAPAWLAIGSEAHGIGPLVSERSAARLSLPLAAGLESLNAAAAGAIACFLYRSAAG